MTAPRQFPVAAVVLVLGWLAGCANPVIVMPWAVEEEEATPPPHVIYFERDAYKVEDSYRPMLEAHARRMKASPSLRLLIQATTDRQGPNDYNRALSRKRAEMVMRQLVALGVPADRLEIAGLGEVRKAARAPHVASANDRRVELIYR